jgi:hypothetical protein
MLVRSLGKHLKATGFGGKQKRKREGLREENGREEGKWW